MKFSLVKKRIFDFTVCFSALFTATLYTACTKENSQRGNKVTSSQSSDAATGRLKLVLQPGEDGQDAYVVTLSGDHGSNANTNFNSIPELAALVWTINGAEVKERSFVKFSGLSAIPAGAHIVGAQLHLYGISSSINHPQGNSVYPGSPYLPMYPDNSCSVVRVVTDWDQTTITWNTQPRVDSNLTATIYSSKNQWNEYAVVDVTDLVQRMINSGKLYGFRIAQAQEVIYRSQQFAVSEDPNPDKRPKLVVYYK